MGGWDFIGRRFNGPVLIFGQTQDGKHVDIADSEDMTLVGHVTKEDAEKLIKKVDAIMECLVGMAIAFDKADNKAFDEFWWPHGP